MKDTARVLGRMYDAIEYRGYSQEIVEELAQYAGVPVFNGLTDEYHPTQMLADVLTMREHSDKPLHDISYAYLGDARNNMGNSLLLIGAKLGMDVRLGAPKTLWPHEDHVAVVSTIMDDRHKNHARPAWPNPRVGDARAPSPLRSKRAVCHRSPTGRGRRMDPVDSAVRFVTVS